MVLSRSDQAPSKNWLARAAMLTVVGLTIAHPSFCMADAATPTPLDQTLNPASDGDDSSSVFKDMGVVQNKAMEKSGHLLLSTYFSLDFDDDPYTMYGVHFNPGYAFSDFFEMYIDFAPFFVTDERTIVKRVQELSLANGQQATVSGGKAKSEHGVEFLWAPLYGKDSVGLRSIVRSDTFLKFGLAQINYDVGTGMSYSLGLGKTFFLGKSVGLRLTLSGNYQQTIIQDIKQYETIFMVEGGFVFYL